MNSVHCLVVSTRFNLGGAETVTLNQFKALSAQGYQISWCALYDVGSFAEKFLAAGQSVTSNFMENGRDWRGFFKLVSWLRKLKPDCIWFICQPATVFWVRIAASLAGVKCIAAIHNTLGADSIGWRHPYRWLLRFADRIVFVGEKQRQAWLNNKRLGLQPQSTTVIYNGIDTRTSNTAHGRNQLRSELGIGEHDLAICNVSRLSPIKGVDVFVRAVALCNQVMPGLRFIIIGDGSEYAAITNLIAELGLRESIKMLGNRDDVERLLPAFDIGVLSSHSEALPICLLEYMKAGLPMIATDVGSVREVVLHETNGLLVAPNDPAQLADAIIHLALSLQTRQAWGSAARRRVDECFSLEKMLENTRSLLQSFAK